MFDRYVYCGSIVRRNILHRTLRKFPRYEVSIQQVTLTLFCILPALREIQGFTCARSGLGSYL